MATPLYLGRVVKTFLFLNLLFFLVCGGLGLLYVWAVGASCAFPSACPLQPAPTLLPNGIFYAAQTVTTTGYGTGVAVHLARVQWLSIFAMPVTAMFWGVSIGLVYAAITDRA